MSKESRNTPEESMQNYYDLKTEAVDALINAETSETEVTPEEIEKYQKKKFRIPEWLKIFLLKTWFAGAVYYFVGFGLGITNLLDQVVILGVALGLVTDILTNNIIRFIEETPGSNDRWMLFGRKSYASFLFNMIYGVVSLVIVAYAYWLLNRLFDADPETIHIGTEPVLFGILCAALDLLLIKIKHLIFSLFRRNETSS